MHVENVIERFQAFNTVDRFVIVAALADIHIAGCDLQFWIAFAGTPFAMFSKTRR